VCIQYLYNRDNLTYEVQRLQLMDDVAGLGSPDSLAADMNGKVASLERAYEAVP
jgi:hypothetical protein